MSEDDNGDALPGFGWAARLMRWSKNDVTVRGLDGPLPPSRRRKADGTDRADDADNEVLFGAQHGMLGLIGGSLQQFFNEPRQRQDLYRIYDMMDKTDLPGTYLDLVAEESTKMDPETQRTLWIKSKSKEMVDTGNEMLRRLHTEEEITGQARDVTKYGDDFERTVYASGKGKGVFRIIPQHPNEMMRKENKEGRLDGYTQQGKKFKSGKSDTSYPWDYVHFRVRGTDRYFGYGTSLLKNAIRPWRQLVIMEDWMVHYQVSRAPDRNLVLLDVGASSEVDAAEVQRRFRQKLKRHMIVDPAGSSGQNLNYNYNPILPTEDMVIAIRNNSTTRVEKMPGSGNAADILPIRYLVDKFFAAVRAPKGFFGFEDPTAPANLKANLCAQDIKFARQCQKIQKAMRLGYTYLLELHYTLQMAGNPEDASFDFMQPDKAFSVHMGTISFLEELERLEVLQIRQQVGMALADMSRDNAAFKAAEWMAFILKDIIKIPTTELGRVLNSAEELMAAQKALLAAKPANINTPMSVGAGAQVDMQKKQMSMQQDANAISAVPEPVDAEQAAASESIAHESDTSKMIQDAVEAARARGAQTDGDLSKSDLTKLSEAIATDPKLRRAINLGVMLWREDGDQILETHGMVLPDRDSAVFKEGALADEITQADIDEMMDEASTKTRRAGG